MTPPSPWKPDRNTLNLAILGKLSEELSEAGAAAARCIIQGIDESEPTTGKVNRQWLEEELADALATISMTIHHFNLNLATLDARTARKVKHLKGWHEHIPALPATDWPKKLGQMKIAPTLIFDEKQLTPSWRTEDFYSDVPIDFQAPTPAITPEEFLAYAICNAQKPPREQDGPGEIGRIARMAVKRQQRATKGGDA